MFNFFILGIKFLVVFDYRLGSCRYTKKNELGLSKFVVLMQVMLPKRNWIINQIKIAIKKQRTKILGGIPLTNFSNIFKKRCLMLMTVHVIIKQLPNINNTKQKFQERTLLEEFLPSRKRPQGASSTRVELKVKKKCKWRKALLEHKHYLISIWACEIRLHNKFYFFIEKIR